MNLRTSICLTATVLAMAMLLNGCGSSGTAQLTSQPKTFVYVSDFQNAAVQVLDSNGNYISQINYSFSSPLGVARDPQGNLYVKDEGNSGSGCAVNKFDSKGNFLLAIGACGVTNGGTGPGVFDNTGWVATDSSGNLWVSSSDFYDIQKYNGSGNFLIMVCTWAYTSNCSMATPLTEQPVYVAVDGSGNLYVVPAAASDTPNVILKVDSTGKYLSTFSGGGNGQLVNIGGIALDTAGNLYVTTGTSVQKFDANGNYLSQFGSVGSAPGDFAGAPGAIAIDAAGNAYVVDNPGYRVLVFDSNGTFLRQFGSYGQGNGQFTDPAGIAVGQ